MAGASQNSTFFCHERQDVSRADEIGCGTVWVDEFSNRTTAFAGRHTGAHRLMVDCHGVGRAVGIGAGTDHGWQFESLRDFGEHGNAQQAFTVRDQEIDRFRSHFFRCADEISFIFSIFGVKDNDDIAALNGCDGSLNRGETMLHDLSKPKKGVTASEATEGDGKRCLCQRDIQAIIGGEWQFRQYAEGCFNA